MNNLSVIKLSIRTVIITFLVIYIGCMALLNIPSIQREIGRVATRELENILKTEVVIGNIDLGLFNRIIIQDVYVKDKEGKPLLKVARFSAKFDLPSLFKGQIRIQSVQLFGAAVHLSKETPQSEPNFRFIVDAFAPKKKNSEKTFVDLRINSILIRRGELSYNVYFEPETPGVFNSSHIGVSNLSANLSLKAFTADSLNMQIRRLSFMEQSGFQFKRLKMRLTADKEHCLLHDMEIALPRGHVRIDSISAYYNDLLLPSDSSFLNYKGTLTAKLVPADIASFVPKLQFFTDTVSMKMDFQNKLQTLKVLWKTKILWNIFAISIIQIFRFKWIVFYMAQS